MAERDFESVVVGIADRGLVRIAAKAWAERTAGSIDRLVWKL